MVFADSSSRVPPPLQVPLLRLLLPYLVGMVLGMTLSLPKTEIWAIPAFGLPFLLALCWRMRRSHLFPVVALLLVLIGLFRWELVTPKPPQLLLDYPEVPPREIQAEIQVQRLFQVRGTGPVSGIAKITQADTHLKSLEGSRLYFDLWPDHSEGQVIPTSRFHAQGMLSSFQNVGAALAGSDFQDYLEQNGVYLTLTVGSLKEISYPGKPFRRWCSAQNRKFANILDTSPESFWKGKAIWKAMMLGETEFLTHSMKEDFRHSGTMHFFAISGLHIGIIATLLGLFLRILRVPLKASPWIGLPLLFLFVQITGNSPSAVRAWVMITFFWMALAVSRKPCPLSAWVASALFTLLIFPRQLLNPGFQLSYAVVGMILLYGLPLAAWLSGQFKPFKNRPQDLQTPWHRLTSRGVTRFLEGFAISLAAFLISQPISLYFFGLLSPISLILNVFLVVLAFPVIFSGMVCLIGGSIFPPGWFSLLHWGTCLLLEFKLFLIQVSIQLPGSTLFLEVQNPFWVAGGTAALLAIGMLARTKWGKPREGIYLFLPPLTFCFLFPLLLV